MNVDVFGHPRDKLDRIDSRLGSVMRTRDGHALLRAMLFATSLALTLPQYTRSQLDAVHSHEDRSLERDVSHSVCAGVFMLTKMNFMFGHLRV